VALVLGVVALSCGSGAERQTVSGPAPVALQPTTADDGGSVTEAAKPATTLLCHYDATTGTKSDLNVPVTAVQGHLGHGDGLGSCIVCPCFSAADLAPSCGGNITTTELCTGSPKYDVFLGCPTGGGIVFVVEVTLDVTLQTCSADRAQGNDTPLTTLTLPQEEACRTVIVSSPYYTCG
jgi:hypothetical protein